MSATISLQEETELKHLFLRGLGHDNESNIIRHHQTRPDLYFHIERYHHPEEPEEELEENPIENIVYRLNQAHLAIPPEWNRNQGIADYRPPLILYTPLRSFAEGSLNAIASGHFAHVRRYTGQTGSNQRENIRRAFVRNEFDCLIATSAFGMGIDKPDVWMTSYIGMPHTVKGLYQAFGRAARRSNWDSPDHHVWNSGVCFAAIPHGNPRPFRAELGILKTLERLYDLFSGDGTKFINGYALVPIFSGIDVTAWRPSDEEWLVCAAAADDDEDDDSHDDYSLTTRLLEIEENRREEERIKEMRRNSLFSKRMWTISSLHRTREIEFLGIHREVLFRSRNSDETRVLPEVLSSGGYNAVMDLLSNIPQGFAIDSGSRPYAVLRFNKLVSNWSELGQICVEGYNVLKQRHQIGRNELLVFLKNIDDGECIRSQFAITIGADQQESCADNQSIPGSMPCSNCRQFILPDRVSDNVLWSDLDTTRELGWHVEQTAQYPWDKFEWSNRGDYMMEYLTIDSHQVDDYDGLPMLGLSQEGKTLCNGDFSTLDSNEYQLIKLHKTNYRPPHGTIKISRQNDRVILMYDGEMEQTVWQSMVFNTNNYQCYFW